jgi:hypothetical protein
MIRDKSVKLKNGKHVCSEKQLDGTVVGNTVPRTHTHTKAKEKASIFCAIRGRKFGKQILQEARKISWSVWLRGREGKKVMLGPGSGPVPVSSAHGGGRAAWRRRSF